MDQKFFLKTLVETESPSHDKAAVDRVGAIVAEQARTLGGQVELISNQETGNHGQLLATGSPSDLRSRTSAPRLYVTGQGLSSQILEDVKNNPLVKRMQQQNGRLVLDLNDLMRSYEIVTQLVKAGVQIDEVRKEKADLEDVFLQLVEEEPRGQE